MNMQTLALAFLAFTAVGGLAWVFVYPSISGERKAESRRASIARPEPAARQVDKNQRSRREQVEGSLKELDARRQKQKSVPLPVRLTQAGLGGWTTQKFWIVSGIVAVVGFAGAFMVGGGLLGALGIAFAAGFGLPRWMLGYLKKRREKAFLRALPDAVDVIVRGIKAGLPLFEFDQGGRRRRAGAPEGRVPRHHRDPNDRHTAGRRLCAPVRTDAGAGSQLLRHCDRDPAEVGR